MERDCKLIVDCPVEGRNFIGYMMGIISLHKSIANGVVTKEYIYRKARRVQIGSVMDGPTLQVSLPLDFSGQWKLVYKIRRVALSIHLSNENAKMAYCVFVKIIFPQETIEFMKFNGAL